MGMRISVMMGHVFRCRAYEHENTLKEDFCEHGERT